MNTTIELLKDAVSRNQITVDDAMFALVADQCSKCCQYGGGGNDSCKPTQ